MQRKLNLLLLLFSLIGGAVAFVIGELLMGRLLGDWPSILVVGLYFAIVALGVGLGCLLAEMISPAEWLVVASAVSWLVVETTPADRRHAAGCWGIDGVRI